MQSGAAPAWGLIIIIPLILIALALFGFWLWMLVDCLTNNGLPGIEKLVWVVVILFAHALGGLIYFFVARPKRHSINSPPLT